MSSKLKIKLVDGAIMPSYATEGSSGLDFYANIDKEIQLKPMERMLVPTGVYIIIEPGFEGQLRAKSGNSVRHGLTLINAVGTIDSDYRNEVKVPLVNLSNETAIIQHGDAIAQLIIAPYERVETEVVTEEEYSANSKTERGEGGFGSTGRGLKKSL